MIRTLRNRKKRDQEKGFTLVELAIVIVIIGLIVGGILVGQDLIRAATIRATLGDLEKYNSGATTFRTKYGGLPGDILASNAVQFGLLANPGVASHGRDGARGKGDGNGLLEGCALNSAVLGCETALFWTDLSQAGLIPQDISDYVGTGVNAVDATVDSIAIMQGYMPTQRVRQGTFQHVYTQSGRNVFALGSHLAPAGDGVLDVSAGVTPGEARSMDEKLDDAFPHVGVVVAMDVQATPDETTLVTVDPGNAAPAAATECVNDTAANRVYNVTDSAIDNINCVVQFRASF